MEDRKPLRATHSPNIIRRTERVAETHFIALGYQPGARFNLKKILIKIFTKILSNFLSKYYNRKIKKPEEIHSFYTSPFQIGLSLGFLQVFFPN